MKTVFGAALAVFLLLTATAFPAQAAFVVKASWSDPPQHVQHIAPTIQIKTDSTTLVDLNGYTISYYLYEGALPVTFGAVTGQPAGTTSWWDRLPMTYTGANGKNANFVLRVQVNSSIKVSSTQALQFTLSVAASPLRDFTQTDDWSYVTATPGSFVTDTNITLSTNGKGGLFYAYGSPPTMDLTTQLGLARQKIKHVFIIMQENHSFDNLFGTYPGADGLASAPSLPAGSKFTCGGTDMPIGYKQILAAQSGTGEDLPHVMRDAKRDLACATSTESDTNVTPTCTPLANYNPNILDPRDFLALTANFAGCNQQALDQTLGYFNGAITTADPDPLVFRYWQLAGNFMLQDRMFPPAPSYSMVTHFYAFSGWSAQCTTATNCTEDMRFWPTPAKPAPATKAWLWNDVTEMFFTHTPRVSWGVFNGENWNSGCSATACKSSPSSCVQAAGTDPIVWFWNPLKNFRSVIDRTGTGTGKDPNWSQKASYSLTDFLTDVNQSTDSLVPQVNWIIPGFAVSEHPGVTGGKAIDQKNGEAYVTMLIQQIMKNTALWNNSAVFLAWDDWGGYYDHVRPQMDTSTTPAKMVYGIRVPGITISPFIHTGGSIDHQMYTFDSYLKFIEDIFVGSSRISSSDQRPAARGNVELPGDLLNEFDFNRTPIVVGGFPQLRCTP